MKTLILSLAILIIAPTLASCGGGDGPLWPSLYPRVSMWSDLHLVLEHMQDGKMRGTVTARSVS